MSVSTPITVRRYSARGPADELAALLRARGVAAVAVPAGWPAGAWLVLVAGRDAETLEALKARDIFRSRRR